MLIKAVLLKDSNFEPKSILPGGKTGPWTHQQGPTVGKVVIRLTTYKLYTHATSYRTYWLKMVEPAHAVSSKTIKRNLQNLQIHLLDLKFDRIDLIAITKFLTELSKFSEDLKLSELKAYLALGKFVLGETATHYRTAVRSYGKEEWLEHHGRKQLHFSCINMQRTRLSKIP